MSVAESVKQRVLRMQRVSCLPVTGSLQYRLCGRDLDSLCSSPHYAALHGGLQSGTIDSGAKTVRDNGQESGSRANQNDTVQRV